MDRLAQQTGRPKSPFIWRAVEEFLDEQDDYMIALPRIQENFPTIPLEKVLKYAYR